MACLILPIPPEGISLPWCRFDDAGHMIVPDSGRRFEHRKITLQAVPNGSPGAPGPGEVFSLGDLRICRESDFDFLCFELQQHGAL